MPPMLRPLAFVAVALVGLLNGSCDDDTAPEPPTKTASLVASASPSPTATAAPNAMPPAVAKLIAAVGDRDGATVASMLQTPGVPCTDRAGSGGRPKCWLGGRSNKDGAPPPLQPDTVVDVFPLSSCEFGWYEPAVARDLVQSILPSAVEPYAVVRLVRPMFEYPATDTNYPSAEFAVVYVRRASGQPEQSVVFALNDVGVTHVNLPCGGAPAADALERIPLYRDAEVMFRGAALTPVTPTRLPTPPITTPRPPVTAESRYKEATGYLRIPTYDDRRLTPEQRAADPARDPRWPEFIRCMERRGVDTSITDPDAALQADIDRLVAEVNNAGPFFIPQPSGLRYRPTAPSDAFLACERALWSQPPATPTSSR